MIFVAGVHGVGKTTYCKELAKRLQLPSYSASDIIRSQKASAIKSNSKDVSDTDGNQDILIKGLNRLDLRNKEIILDGHFVLLQNSKIQRLPLSTYKYLSIKKIILLSDTPEKIFNRISSRDNSIEFSVKLINDMQEEEILYANEVAALLGIELEIIKVIEKSKAPNR